MKLSHGLFFNNKNKFDITTIEYFSSIKKDIHAILNDFQKENKSIIILWDGNVGDKAKSFVEKTQVIHEVGFQTTQKIMVWSDLARECETDKKFLDRFAQSVSVYYPHVPVLAIRSSGQGDATWIGVYDSCFAINDPIQIARAIEKVLASNNSLTASEYRRIRWITSLDMWIIIEPCIGNLHNKSYFGPELSGWWRTEEDGSMEIWISLWIGWWVRDGDCYRINNEWYWWQSLWEDIDQSKRLYNNSKCSEQNANTHIYRQYFMDQEKYINQSWIDVPLYSLEKNKISSTTVSYLAKKEIYGYSLTELFEGMKNFKRKLKNPQYIERAAVQNNKGGLSPYITQIADDIHKTISIDFVQEGICVCETQNIIHSGIKDFDKVVVMYPWWEDYFLLTQEQIKYVELLSEYNRNNKNYLLIIDAKITYAWWNIPFEVFSNAWGIIEVPNGIWHVSSTSSHYQWLLTATNILFGVSTDKINKILKNLSSQKNEKCEKLQEFNQGNFRLIQDAKKWLGKLFLKK